MDIDREIYRNIAEGRRDAFKSLFYKYYNDLVKYSLSMIESQNEAEDIVQDVFTHLWSNRKTKGISISVKAYLFTSVKYRSLNYLKHKAIERNHHTCIIEFLENAAHEEYKDEENRQLAQINNALAQLPEQCRLVFSQSVLEGKTYKEISADMGISVNTVKSHILKAYRSIRQLIGHNEVTSSLLFLVSYRILYKFT